MGGMGVCTDLFIGMKLMGYIIRPSLESRFRPIFACVTL